MTMNDDQTMQDDDMNCGLTIDERDELRSALRALPETMPPRVVWQRIEEQARAEGLLKNPLIKHALSQPARWLAGTGVAAAVVLAVLTVPGPDTVGPATIATDGSLPTVPAYQESPDEGQLRSINALMVQSQVLERDLRRLPASPQVVRASTAATIDDLQRRIALIDYQLNNPDLRMTREQQGSFLARTCAPDGFAAAAPLCAVAESIVLERDFWAGGAWGAAGDVDGVLE